MGMMFVYVGSSIIGFCVCILCILCYYKFIDDGEEDKHRDSDNVELQTVETAQPTKGNIDEFVVRSESENDYIQTQGGPEEVGEVNNSGPIKVAETWKQQKNPIPLKLNST